MAKRINLTLIAVNLKQGLLLTDNHVVGAYNSSTERYYLKEGLSDDDVTLPESLRDYYFGGAKGHFAVSQWDFSTDKMEDVS